MATKINTNAIIKNEIEANLFFNFLKEFATKIDTIKVMMKTIKVKYSTGPSSEIKLR
jgi:hypothetical protein